MHIRCDQCGRALTASASSSLVCPSCGRALTVPPEVHAAALPDGDDPTTRPVPPEIVAAAAAGAPMPRPAAPPADGMMTPSQPASILSAAGAGSAAESAAPAGQTPQAGAARVDATAPLPPALVRMAGGEYRTQPVPGVPGPSGTGDGAAAPRKRGYGAAISAIGLLIVLVLGSGAAILAANGQLANLFGAVSPAPSPTATSTHASGPPTGFRQYTASDGSYLIDKPATWLVATQPSSSGQLTIFTDSATKANFEIDELSQLVDPAQHNALSIQTLARLLAAQASPSGSPQPVPTVTEPPAPDTVVIANTLWTRTTADISVTAGGQTSAWHAVALSAQHNGSTLLVLYVAPQAVFAQADAASFQPMLSSLALAPNAP